MRSIYYAAPFFNPHEFDVMTRMFELTKYMPHLKMFFPFEASKEHQGKIQEPSSRRQVYLANEQALIHNSEMLAWIDRIQPNGQQVQLCKSIYEGLIDGKPRSHWEGDGRELKQPDLGTVWEIGFARARGKVIAAFTLQEKAEAKLNLMLTESVDIILYGWDEVIEYLSIPHPHQIGQYIRHKQSFWRGDVE